MQQQQQQSSEKSHPTADDYVTPNQIHQHQQPQYDVIQLGHTQSGPDADQYASLNSETQGQQPEYDFISRPPATDADAAEYVEMD